jgi:hypothetical protein
MLVPEGVTSVRQRARYVVRVYRADHIPHNTDLVDPYVQISFAGTKVRVPFRAHNYLL